MNELNNVSMLDAVVFSIWFKVFAESPTSSGRLMLWRILSNKFRTVAVLPTVQRQGIDSKSLREIRKWMRLNSA